MNKKTSSLSAKLVRANSIIVTLALITFGLIVYFGLWSLSGSFSEFSAENTHLTKESIRKNAEENIARIRATYEQALKKKGLVLLEKDSIFVQRMMEENSFNALRDFIIRFLRNDSSVVYGAFWVVENNSIGAWQVVSNQAPDGLDMPIQWNESLQSWTGGVGSKQVVVKDEVVKSALNFDRATVQLGTETLKSPNGEIVDEKVIDCIIPIVAGMTPEAVQLARAGGMPVGYLRYKLSMREMEDQIAKEQKALDDGLKKIEEANRKATSKLNELAIEKSLMITIVIFIVGVIIVFLVTLASRLFSLRVTKPIAELTQIASEMKEGRYDQKFDIESDDEIGFFADTFQEMSTAIVQRDRDLAAINRDLELKVHERTQQLSKELNTTANLLNNMKQAVFSVDSSGNIIAPVSRSAYSIFGGTIEGQSVFDVVYRDIKSDSLQFDPLKTALVTVFGEDELQWELMEDNFPKRVNRKGAIDKEDFQKLRISYSPLWGIDSKLEHLMFVVEDVTHVEKLETEIKELRAQSEERAQMIQELASANEEAVKGFFSSALFSLAGDLTKRPITLQRLSVIRKHLHTIKGNARACGFVLNSKFVHSQEDRCQEIDRRASQTGLLTENEAHEVDEILAKVRQQISEYSQIANQVFQMKTDFSVPTSDWQSINQSLRLFEKMVNELAKNQNKEANLSVVGEEINMQSMQVQVLRDCFVHLLSNAVTHGIESIESRTAGGKSAAGTVSIEVRRERQNVVLTLTDDGGGIDVDKLKKTVIDRGVKEPSELEQMTREQLLEMVFLPNISSSEAINEYSGRGLGLDVVKENILLLGGTIRVMSEVGSGTVFEITIPSVMMERDRLVA